MKNGLSDLNDYLFAQLERLSDEDMTADHVEVEAKRGQAIVAVADKIIERCIAHRSHQTGLSRRQPLAFRTARPHFTALCKRNGWLTGRTGKFDKGGESWNLGKPMPFNPKSAATQFKKGSVPPNSKPVGHERLTDDGYIMVSIDRINPHTGGPRTYVMKHLHLWQQANGPLPEGMCLKACA